MTTLRQYFPNLRGALLIYWGVLLAALFLFGQFAGEVYEKEGFFFDAPILNWFTAHQTSWLVGTAQAFSTFGSPPVLGGVTAVAVLLLWFRLRERSASLFLTLGLGGAMLINVLFKLFFARVRPALSQHLTPAPGYSFPSGYAMGSAAFFLALYLLTERLFPRWRWVAGIIGVLGTLGIGVSRLVLQIHYPSDVLAGWALSAAWVLGVNLIYARPRR